MATWHKRWQTLERIAATNPFAVVIREDVLRLFRLIDWIITLPPELDAAYTHEVDLIEQEQKMAFVTSIERRGIQKGLQTGQLQGSAAVLRVLVERKFGQLPPWADDRIAAADTATLQQWALNILNADTIDKVFSQ